MSSKKKGAPRTKRTTAEVSAQQRSAATKVAAGTAGKRNELILGLTPCKVLRFLGSKGYTKAAVLRAAITALGGQKAADDIHPSTYGWQPGVAARIKAGKNTREESIPEVESDVAAKLIAAAKKATAKVGE
jgi:hypothetical protein